MIKLLFRILVIYVVFINQMQASSIDTLSQSKKLAKAHTFVHEMKIDSAINYFTLLGKAFEEQQKWDSFAECLNGLSECNWRILNLKVAEEFAKKASVVCETYLSPSDPQYAQSLKNLGTISFYLDDYEQSKIYCNQAKKIMISNYGSNHESVLKINRVLGALYAHEGEAKKSLEIYQHELKNLMSDENYDSLELITAYLNVGLSYFSFYHLDSAEYFLLRTAKMTKKLHGEKNADLGTAYRYLSYLYLTVGELHKALDYALSAEEIFKELYGPRSAYTAGVYHALVAIYMQLGNVEYAVDYSKKGLSIVLEVLGSQHSDVANQYEALAIIYSKTGSDSLQMEYMEKALAIRKGVFGDDGQFVAQSYLFIGDYYFNKADYKYAIEKFRNALHIFRKMYGIKSSQIAEANLYIADSYLEQAENLDSALFYYQAVIESNTYFADPSGSIIEDKYLNDQFQILAIIGKASTLFRSNHLQEALVGFQKCDSLTHRLRWNNISWEDRFSLAESVKNMYEQAVSLSVRMYQETNQRSYYNLALSFLENSKASVLKKSLVQLDNRKLKLLPDQVAAYEKDVAVNINYFESLIKKEKIKEERDHLKISEYEEHLFKLSVKKDSFEIVLRKNYPDYYELNKGYRSTNIDEIQKRLDSNTVLVEFLKTDTGLFSFVITKEDIKVHSNSIDSTFDERLFRFVNAFNSTRKINELTQVDTSFVQEAHYWYLQLLDDPLNGIHSVENIKIIPDGILSYLPFEILLKTSSSITDYRTLDYLIRHYAISYNYSSDEIFTKSKNQSNKKLNYLGFAPSYAKLISEDEEDSENSDLRNSLSHLEWNQWEVMATGERLNGQYFLSDNATESNFRNTVQDSKIIHLAMHALVDDEKPMKSKLVFSAANDSLNDGYLHTYELFDLNLNPELVVLSACNTASGQLKSGEGIMSLAYGFAYSGCSSIVSSLWSVDDKSTSELMGYFYENLDKGMSKSQALQQAKLKMIDGYGMFNSNPFYWGAFILMGEDGPVYDPFDLSLGLFYFLLVVFFVFLFVVIKGIIHSRYR